MSEYFYTPKMIYNSGIAIVKNIGSKYIIVCGSMLYIEKQKIKKDIYHKHIHSGALSSDCGRDSLIEYTFRDPEKILELKGKKRINLLLFLAFTKRIESCHILDIQKHQLTEDQIRIFNIILPNRKFLDQIFKSYPKTFLKICSHLEIEKISKKAGNSSTLDKYYILDLVKKIETLKTIIKNIKNENNNVSFMAERMHIDFCKDKSKSNTKLETFKKNYIGLFNNVKKDQYFNTLFEPSIFYPELRLYNDCILSNHFYGLVNLELLEYPFTTENEKNLRDYIKEKIYQEEIDSSS